MLLRDPVGLVLPSFDRVAELRLLVLVELLVEDVRLLHALLEHGVLEEQLLKDLVAKVEVVHAVAELILRDRVTAAIRARTSDRERPFVGHLDDLFQAEHLILAEQVQVQRLL